MITRIVKMSFHPEQIKTFLTLFEERKSLIRNFGGCNHLELWQDKIDTNTFFTYSIWNSEEDLETYRRSDFFKETWEATRVLFNKKPEAWTVVKKFEG